MGVGTTQCVSSNITMSTPDKTSGATAAAAAIAVAVSPEDANVHKQQHFVAYPSVNSAQMDVAGHTPLHRAIYSIARQANTPSSTSASGSSFPSSSSSSSLSSSPKQMIDRILSTTDGYRSTSVRCRRGGWTPLHLCCRLVVIPEEIVLAIAECNPSAIAIQDDDGENCIHLACRYGLSEGIISGLVALGPQSAFVARDEENGEIPLHAAMHHGHLIDVLKVLVDAYPDSVRLCNDNGQSALHLACEYERHDFVKVAVETMITDRQSARTFVRQIIDADELGSTPISILWNKFVDSFDGSVEDPYCTWFDATDAKKESKEQAATWASLVAVMTTALFTGGALGSSTEEGHTLLRSAIGLGVDAVPASLFQYIVSRYPLAVQKVNSNGQLPLQEAILALSKPQRRANIETNVSFVDQRDDDFQERGGAESDDRESRTGKHASEDEEKKLQYESSDDESLSPPSSFDEIQDVLEAMRPTPFHVVLDAYPQAASIPCGDGRLALHLAIGARISWSGGLSKIFDAAPGSLRVPDPKTGLVPSLLAATFDAGRPPCREKDVDCVDSINTVFQLLRLGPDLITSCIQSDDEQQKRKAFGGIAGAVVSPPCKRARITA
jgi:ankyrin repeat protein